MLLVCALFVCSNATITDVVWPSIISFSGSPFWYNLEVPVALNVYRPLATLVAYINKYTWQLWMTKCVHQNKINILWRVSLSIVHSPISMRIYDCMRWMKANDVRSLLCVLNTEAACGAPDIHSNIPNSIVLPSVFLGKCSTRAPLSILFVISMDSWSCRQPGWTLTWLGVSENSMLYLQIYSYR